MATCQSYDVIFPRVHKSAERAELADLSLLLQDPLRMTIGHLCEDSTWFNDFLLSMRFSPVVRQHAQESCHCRSIWTTCINKLMVEMMQRWKSWTIENPFLASNVQLPSAQVSLFYDAFDMLFKWIMCWIYLVPTKLAILLHTLPVYLYHAYSLLGKFMPIPRYNTSLDLFGLSPCKSCSLKVETAKFKAADLDGDSVLSAHEVASLFYPET